MRGGGRAKIVILISIDRMSPSETKGGSIPRDQVQNNFNNWKKLGVAINNSKYKNIKRSLLIVVYFDQGLGAAHSKHWSK